MATVRIEFETDNAAFEDAFHLEVKHVLKKARETIFGERESSKLFDSNGNTVGKVTVKG